MDPLSASRVAVKRALASPLGWQLTSPLRKRGCMVLTYHRLGRAGDPFPHIDARVFRQHMEWVRANCEPIGPADLPHAAGRKGRPAVLVTFDDAYADYFEHAYPVLSSLRIPAVCFVATEYVDKRLTFWWDVVHEGVRASTVERARMPWGQEFALDATGRAALLQAAKAHIKRVADRGRDRAVDDLLTALQVDRASLPLAPSTMSWEQVRAARDVTTFGGHTHTHALMRGLAADRLAFEVETCRDRLAAETGAVPRVFAYPSGAFDEAAKAAVRNAGFDLGFSTLPGVNGRTTDWMEIRRVHAPGTIDNLGWLMSGVTLPWAVPVGHGPS
jgi:peptidoglycan/xylan/chitin deacetylase (PgdA/CDA1 family)